MKPVRHAFARDDGGQAIVVAAIMFMALLFAVGLAVDAGQLYVAKRTEQEAADAAAFAGAVVIYQGNQQPPSAATVAAARSAAAFAATQNGYTDDGGIGNTTVIVNSPPTAGAYNNDPNHVEVIITRRVQTSLVPAEAAFNPVRARGVAGAESFNNGYALMALDQNCDADAFNVAPNMDIHLVGGGSVTNSCSPSAATGFRNTDDLTINPGSFDIVGGYGSSSFPPGITVNTGIAPVPDPFAGYPKPNPAGLPVNPPTGYGSTAFQGVYTSTLSGVNLCHGIYILKGGGMGGDIGRDTNPAHTDPNTGKPCDGKVFIFNTMSNYPTSPGGTCSQIGTNGNHPITIRPMTSPPETPSDPTWPYINFQLYQDPRCTVDVQIGGNQTLDAGGTIYVPTATIHMNGNPATIDGGQLIAYKLDIQNGNLNITYAASNTAQPTLPRLAE